MSNMVSAGFAKDQIKVLIDTLLYDLKFEEKVPDPQDKILSDIVVVLRSLSQDDDVVFVKAGEYDSLREDSMFLECLKGCGVDNWSGYDEATEMFWESEDL